MSGWSPKRFWKQAEAIEFENGFSVVLDSRGLKTPLKTAFWVPTRAMAEEVAKEWQAQGEKVDPETMPYTRTANSAIDKVTPQFTAVADMLAAYGGSDLLCYRAEAPQELVLRQKQAWDPVLGWAEAEFGAKLKTTQGIMPIDQPEASLRKFSQAVHALTPFQLAAFHDLVAITGSLVLGLAISRGEVSPDMGFDLSRIDETWQTELWGADEEAAESEALKRESVRRAARFFALCG